MKIGSLFSGIGGLELGLERGLRSAGIEAETVFQVEQDEYCRAVLAKHWPNAKRYEDVRNVGRETLESVDIICGGFPCQDISAAGKREGIRGERSGLWSEYARVIRDLRPRFVVVENVAALLVRGLDVVLGELAESGYDAEWFVLAAADVGAPHIRERVFILAYPASDLRGTSRNARSPAPHGRSALLAHADGLRARPIPEALQTGKSKSRRAGAAIPNASVERGDDGRGQQRTEDSERARGADQWSVEPDVGRVAHGVPSRVDRLRALGNAVVPQVAEVVGCLIAEREKELRLSA